MIKFLNKKYLEKKYFIKKYKKLIIFNNNFYIKVNCLLILKFLFYKSKMTII
jgi:hypothetical protein